MGKPKLPDIPFMLEKIAKDGYTREQMAEVLGCSPSQIYKVMTERIDVPDQWLVLYYLIDWYITLYDRPIPFYGDHNVLTEGKR